MRFRKKLLSTRALPRRVRLANTPPTVDRLADDGTYRFVFALSWLALTSFCWVMVCNTERNQERRICVFEEDD